MELVASPYMMVYRKYMPHFLIILVQIGYAVLYIITKASFDHGMNPHVFVTYRYVVGGLVMFPFAYFLERKVRPKMTFTLFLEIFLLSLLGGSLTFNMYFASLKYTSPTFVTSIINTIASMTLIIAVILRLEALDVKNLHGMAKVIGTLISLGGVLTMILHEGPAIKSSSAAPIHIRNEPVRQNWIKGSILVVASCLSWSFWYIMQAFTLKKYPAQLSLTTWMNCIAAAQSAAFTIIIEHRREAWIISTYRNDLWPILYAGVVFSALAMFIQVWCTKKKGPVFVTIFNPLATLFVAILAYFVLGETLHIGRMLGAVIIIIGLYLVLWGKDRDEGQVVDQEHKEPKLPMKETSAERAEVI
ncbi:hypothetical protein FNV43_RR23262 [Rhamnella rubrinervis]|uniref:WAT1-related protein n=1 Tax=Rhamnella rubrinervis TaxID=2594499 RepID=A0A8K0DYK7_9ROSA|nr:hypothetical protein FNV43_RR23262 [Rhamnella rubrinervis]